MIHSIISGNVKKIFFECCSDSFCNEMNQLAAELALCENENVEITFSRVGRIPIHVIDKLFAIKELQIFTENKSLWLYLGSLKFNTKLLSLKPAGQLKYNKIKAIFIGGSAGSLDAIMDVISSLPYVEISIFLTLHILPSVKNDLAGVIQASTKYNVVEALNGAEIEKSTIYIAPPDNHLCIVDNKIVISHENYVNFARPSIDVMFLSASNFYKDSAIAILFCGYGNDGSLYLSELMKNETQVIIENPDCCSAKDMLNSAIATKYYDKICTVDEIKVYLDERLKTFLFENDEVKYFVGKLYENFGFDFRDYEVNFLKRRINIIRSFYGAESIGHIMDKAFSNMNVLNDMLQNFLINVTSFFRNPDTFEQLRVLIDDGFKNQNFLRIWCAGCSSGQEPYSVAMLLGEMGLLEKTQIYATDYDSNVLIEARNGIYSNIAYHQLIENYQILNFKTPLEHWIEVEKNFIKIKQDVKKHILFFDHNLVTDASINEFDIVFCRNVMIYFDKKLQSKVLTLIHESMSDNSLLVIGESENPNIPNKFKKISNIKKSKIFSKI